MLSVLERLSPELDDVSMGSELDANRQQIAAALRIPNSGLRAYTDEVVAMRVELWSDAHSEKNCSVQVALCCTSDPVPRVQEVRELKDGLNLHDPHALDALVKQLLGILSTHCRGDINVPVEFVLPRDMLSHPVDQWRDQAGEPLGKFLMITVRSRERLRNASMRLGWNNSWESLMIRRQDMIPYCLWWYGVGQEGQVWGQLQRGACVALTFVPDARARQNAVSNLLHRGTAIALWPRQADGLADLVSQFENLFAGRSLEDLPDVMRDIRRGLWETTQEQTPCCHLTLLWDDPTHHIPEDEDDFLQGPA